MRKFVISFIIIYAFFTSVFAQDNSQYFQLDPKPYDPAVDVDTDMFISDWHNSLPRSEHGNLIVRDIFTRHKGDDPLKPVEPGAVLNVLTEYAYATLDASYSTTPSKLIGEQKIFYVLEGSGTVTAGMKTEKVFPNVTVLIPEGLEFTVKNTGDTQLTMLIIGEPTYEGFTPLIEMIVKDENKIPISSTTGHWININKILFRRGEGLATIIGISPVWLDPVTMAQPHASRGLGTDVLWYAIEGDIFTLFGKKLYHLKPGMAFKNPSDGKVYHANINVTDKQIKLLWVRTVSPEEFKKLGK
ncbi:MAG: cupin domain-containing protein [Candidatus Latescibacteria bacterium]|nr:cupin domain-containing protein [Candidatus Latescibacterota bacterium]